MMKYKYPSTPHLPCSRQVNVDDTTLDDYQNFVGKSVVITEKMDGENATLARDYYHARSLDSRHHPSRDWIKSFWGAKRYFLDDGIRLCGENLYAKHSIEYNSLPSYFMLFSVWDRDYSLGWDEVVEYAYLLELETVPVLYEGEFSLDIIKDIIDNLDLSKQEGFVIRNRNGFHISEFADNMGKFVRKNHVQTDKHWMFSEVMPNGLK